MKITYETINKFEPRFLPGDTVWEITDDCEPREISISSVECFYNHFRYNIHSPKETTINWFTEDYVDIMDKRAVYPGSAVWSSKEKLLTSFRFWEKRQFQANKELSKITSQDYK